MAIITYEIDPGGDMYLVLEDPNSQNIVPIIDKGVKDNSNDAFDNPPLVGRYEVFNKVVKDTSVDGSGELRLGSNTDITEVHMRVSSRHLILTSRTFRKMLEGGWSESSSADVLFGLRLIQTSGWDAAALAIVLDAIHGHHRDIPKYTNLGLLTRIVTIVDYYQCHESIQLIGDVWMATLCASCPVPNNYCHSTLLWLYISWVFPEKGIFSSITRMLLRESDGLSEIELFDLPLSGVIDIVETKRQELIGRLIAGMENLRERLSEEGGCLVAQNPNCSSIMLGILIREQRKLKLLDPPLVAPYTGYSISNLKALISKFPQSKPEKKIRDPYQAYGGAGYGAKYDKPCSCTIGLRLNDLLKEIENDLGSFDLTTQE